MTENRESAASELEAERRSEQAGQLVMTARMTLRRGERAEAKKTLAQALKVDPSDIGALELLGDIFLEDAEQEKAIQVFEHGQKCHPDYAPFEEKMAVARLDLAEVERDKLLKQDILESGGISDKLLDKKPALALGLSVLVPGAGQFYNDEWEKAGIHFALWLAALSCWSYPLMTHLRRVWNEAKGQRFVPGIGDAIDAMSSGTQFFFWLMMFAWLMVYVASAIDATTVAARINDQRRRELGI